MRRAIWLCLPVFLGCNNRLVVCPSTDAEDPLTHLGRSNTSTFFETTDVVTAGDVVYACTGVQGLTVHDASTPKRIKQVDQLNFPGSDQRYPRCSHLDVWGDRLVVVSHRDEIQTTPWVALVDISDPLSPKTLDYWETPSLLEEPALVGDQLFVAAHDEGVLVFDVSDDRLSEPITVGGMGNVGRVAAAGSGVAVGTLENALFLLDETLAVSEAIPMPAAVQGIQDLHDGRVAVAVGSAGLILVELSSRAVVAEVDTNGTALRLDCLSETELLVANWTDVRVYDIRSQTPELLAVDALFEADDQPRILAAAAGRGHVYAGEWTGLHALAFDGGGAGPEFTPDVLSLKVPADGDAHTTTLTVTNEGNAPLHITRVDAPRGWSATVNFEALASGETGELSVTYEGGTSPTASTLNLCTNDPDERPARVAVEAGSDALTVGDMARNFDYLGVNTGARHTVDGERGNVVVLSYFATF